MGYAQGLLVARLADGVESVVRSSESMIARCTLFFGALFCCSVFMLPAIAAAAPYPAHVWPEAAAPFWSPADTAVALDGEVFVADTGGGRIVRLASDGTRIGSFNGSELPWTKLIAPRGVTVGPDARVWVADAGTHRIHVFERNGTPVRSFGGYGSGAGQLAAPSAVAFDSAGTVYVADTQNDRIVKSTSGGDFLGVIGTSGPANGQLLWPSGVQVYNGEVYVCEENGLRVQVFSTSGLYLRQWGISGGSGSTVSRYVRPTGIDVDGSGRVVVSDAGRHQIERCNTSGAGSAFYGALGSVVGALSNPGAPTFGGNTIMVGDRGNDRVARFDTVSSSWLSPWRVGGGSSAPGKIDSAKAVALASDGTVFVADTGNNRIQKFDSAGALISVFSTAGPAALSSPAGIAVNEDNAEVYVSNTGASTISVFDLDGNFLRSLGSTGTFDAQFNAPRALAYSPTGGILIADTGNHRVQVIDRWGGFISLWGGYGTAGSQFISPEGVGVSNSPTGVLFFVADTGNHRIQVFDATGRRLNMFGSYGSGPGQFRVPVGVATDPSGDIFVLERGGNRIQRLTASGAPVESFGSPGANPGDYRSPGYIAASANGSLAIADTGNHRIQVLENESQPPTTTATGELGVWVSHPVTVTLSSSDASSGVAAIWYRINNGPEQAYDRPFVVSAENTTVVSYWAIDRCGNVEATRTCNVLIDTTPPSGPVTFAGGATAIATTSVSAHSAFTDVATMRFNGGPGWTPVQDYSADATFTTPGEGTRTVSAQYMDAVNNTLTVSAQLLVDLSAPVTTLTRAPASTPTSVNVSVSAAAVDSLSGVAGVRVTRDGGSETTYTAPLLFTTEGTHAVTAYGIDAVGNVGAVTTSTFVIDKTPPSGALVVAGGVTYANSSTVSLAITSPDAVSMRVNPGSGFGAIVPLQSPVAVTLLAGDGPRTVRVQLYDTAGNSTVVQDDVVVDKTAPLSTLLGVPPTGYAAGDVSLSLSARDDAAGVTGSGVTAIRYSLDGEPETDYSTTLTVTTEGAHSVTYRAIDALGWSETARTATFTIDLTPPTIALSGAPASGITSKNVDVVASATDAVSGVAAILTSRDGGAEATYSAPLSFTTEGTHTVSAYSMDRAQRTSETTAVLFVIDRTAPVGSVTIAGGASYIASTTASAAVSSPDAVEMCTDEGTGFGPRVPFSEQATVTLLGEGTRTVRVRLFDAADNVTDVHDTVFVDLTAPLSFATGVPRGGYSADDVIVTLSSSDAGAGLARIRYALDGTGESTYSSPVTVTAEGTHTIDFAGIDVVGNRESTQSVTFVIDRTIPVGSFVLAGGRAFTNSTAVSCDSSITSAVDMAFDTGSGFGDWMPYASRAAVTLGEGTHTVVAAYRSRAGIVVYRSDDVVVDVTAPTVSAVAAAVENLKTLTGGKWRFDTRFTWLSADGGSCPSGIAERRWTDGRADKVASADTVLVAIQRPGVTFSVRARDVAGSVSAVAAHQILIGTLATPTVPPSARIGVAFTAVAPAGSDVSSGTLTARCYRLVGPMNYSYLKSVPASVMTLGGVRRLYARPALPAGRYLIVFQRAGVGYSALSGPSSGVTVR